MIRVLLADDQEMVRAGFGLLLSAEEDIEVVGEAAHGEEAVTLVGLRRPDVVLMDLQMPVLDGLEATRRIVAEHPEVKVLILTTFERDHDIFDALRAGASGYLLKLARPEELLDAIRVVASGQALLSPSVTRRVLESFTGGASAVARPAALDQLTAREVEVLELVARGQSNAEIAETLILGEATIKTHVSNVLSKLGLRDRVQAVVYAYEHGVVIPGS